MLRSLPSSFLQLIPDLIWEVIPGAKNSNAGIYTLYTCLTLLANNIMLTAAMVVLIGMITGGSTTAIGTSEGIFGFCALIPGILGGHASDTGDRFSVLRAGGALILSGCALLSLTLLAGLASPTVLADLQSAQTPLGSAQLICLCAGVSLLQAGQSLADPSAKALSADCIPRGSRLAFYSEVQVWGNLCKGLGPILSLGAFSLSGNAWTEGSCSLAILLGCSAKLCTGALCFCFVEGEGRGGGGGISGAGLSTPVYRRAISTGALSALLSGSTETLGSATPEGKPHLTPVMWCGGPDSRPHHPHHPHRGGGSGREKEGRQGRTSTHHNPQYLPPRSAESPLLRASPLAQQWHGGSAGEATPLLAGAERRQAGWWGGVGGGGGGGGIASSLTPSFWVPALYLVSDLIWCFGSGMTVKFFAVFFQQPPEAGGLGLAPSAVMGTMAALPFVVMGVTPAALAVARQAGRIPTDFLLWYSGNAFLLAMVALGYAGHFTEAWYDRCAVLLLYVARTSLLSATAAVQQSVIMDHVPPSARARWASLDALTNMGWAGSAAVGGYLLRSHSYQFVFLCTALLHLLATLVKIPLLFIVEDGPGGIVCGEEAQEDGGACSPGAMQDEESSELLT